MKAVLISIQPKWCELIASGKKTVEVRKTRPKIETPFNCYIYQTKTKWMYDFLRKIGLSSLANKLFIAKGKVIGEFVCDSIAQYESELWDDETFERIQEFYEPDDFAEYGEYEFKTIADNGDDFWKDNMLCRASCVSIEELRNYIGTGIHNFCGWHISDLVIYDKPKELSEFVRFCPEWEKEELTEKCFKECEHYFVCHSECFDGCDCEGELPITRPPQSWCYVEEL